MERYLKLDRVPREQFIVALGCNLWDGKRHSCGALSVDQIKELVSGAGLDGLDWEKMTWNQKALCFSLVKFIKAVPNGVDHFVPKDNRLVCRGFENGMYPACNRWQSRSGSNEVLVQFGGCDRNTGEIEVARVPHEDYLRFEDRIGGFDLINYLSFLRASPSF